MTDYVHQHFAAHPDCTVRPHVTCADGCTLSVQASEGHYCTPRADFAPHYTSVEVAFPTDAKRQPLQASFAGRADGGQPVWGWVPVTEVNDWIEAHGGLKQGGEA